MKKLNEDQLVPIIIDLNVSGDQINESFLRSFGAAIELIIKRMFGLNGLNFQARGPASPLRQLADTLVKEKEYIEAFNRFGLNNPSVINNRHRLEKAIRDFENQTGIKWPLK